MFVVTSPIRLVIQLSLVLCACTSASISDTVSINVTDTTLVTPVTVTPDLPYSTQSNSLALSRQARQIDSGKIFKIEWSLDSTILYYSKGVGGGDWAYNFSFGTIDPLQPGAFSASSPIPQYVNVPAGAEQIFISPSGKKVLYLLAFQPTPITLEGEHPLGQISELWLWENGKTSNLGALLDCVAGFYWTNDEEKAVAYGFGTASACNPDAVIDFTTGTVHSLADLNAIHMSGLSPDGTRLLYYNDNLTPYLLNLETLQITAVDIPGAIASRSQWFDDQSLLLLLRIEDAKGNLTTKVGRLDLFSSQFTEIVSPTLTPELEGLAIEHLAISPDRNWLAFYAENSLYNAPYGVWLIKIPK